MEHPHVVIEVAKQVENNMEHPYVLLEIAKQLDNSTRIVFSQTNKTIYNTIKYYFRKEVAISAYLGKVLLFQWSSLDGSEDKDFIKTACINFLKWLLDCDDFKKYLDNISEGAININSRKVNQMSDYVKDKIIPHVKRVLEASKDELTGNWVNLNLEAAHYIVNYWNQLYYDYNLNTYKTLNGWFHPTIINTPFFDYSYSSYLECEKNWKKTLLVINLKKTDTTPTDLRLMYTFICDVYSVGTNGSKYEGDGIRRFSSIVGVNFYNGDKDIVSNTRSHMLCVDYRIPNVDVNFYKIVDTLHVAYPSTAGKIKNF